MNRDFFINFKANKVPSNFSVFFLLFHGEMEFNVQKLPLSLR